MSTETTSEASTATRGNGTTATAVGNGRAEPSTTTTNGNGHSGTAGAAAAAPVSPTPPAATPAPVAEPTSSTPWLVALAVLVTGMFMSVLDVSIVNVAIPAMQKEWGTSTEDIQWVATAYSLALGVIVPASAWLGERIGLSRAYLLSLISFAAGSALCGLAWDLNSMIVFRVLQAIPGGIIPVVALSMVYKIVPREKIGAAMGLYGLGIVVAPAVGPTLGGYLVEYVDWRLIFFINVPVGVVGAIAAFFLLPAFRGGRAGRFDVPGFLLISSALFAALLAISEAPDWGWDSYGVLMLLTYAPLALALFVVVELETEEPMLDVRVFRSVPFSISLVLIAVISVGLFGVLFYIPQFLQEIERIGAFDSGLILLPQALVMAVLMPMAGRIYDKIGPRVPAVAGLAILALGTWMLRDVNLDTSWTELKWILAFRACGMGLAMMPIMTGGLSSVPPDRVSGASAFNNVTQRVAAAIGLAGLTAFMTYMQNQGMADRGSLMGVAPSTSHVAVSPGGSFGAAGFEGASPLGGNPMSSMAQQMQGQAFATAMDNMMMVVTVLTVVGLVLAMFLRHGPAPAGEGDGPAVVEA